jgi:hypothetical protein
MDLDLLEKTNLFPRAGMRRLQPGKNNIGGSHSEVANCRKIFYNTHTDQTREIK